MSRCGAIWGRGIWGRKGASSTEKQHVQRSQGRKKASIWNELREGERRGGGVECIKEAVQGSPWRPFHLDLIQKTTGNPRNDLSKEVSVRFIFQKGHSAAA